MKLMAGLVPDRGREAARPRRRDTLPSGFVALQLTPAMPRRKQPETANIITQTDHGHPQASVVASGVMGSG